ncbi:FUT11, partial [Cordylochernes scorpioides]
MEAFTVNSNMSTDAAPSYRWSGTIAEAHQPEGKAVEVSVAKLEKPLIIWWTPNLFPHIESGEVEINCKIGTCITSNNRTLQNDPRTSAFIFYGTEMDVEDMPIPREKNHRWALLHEESPMNNYILSHNLGLRLFNYTSTFSRRSDYPLTTQYIPSINYLIERKPVELKIKNELRKKGFAPVLYIQSNCNVASDRDRYIIELSKYIQIDSYGECLQNKTLPKHLSTSENFNSTEFLDYISQYKFHLAFENAICDDYISEKLFRALHVGSIPIYRGSPSVEDWLPSTTSAILTHDYLNPKELAKDILRIDQDDELYNTYLNYKEPDGFANDFLEEHLAKREWGEFISGFECYVCDQLLLKEDTDKKQAELAGCPEPQPAFGKIQDLPPDD